MNQALPKMLLRKQHLHKLLYRGVGLSLVMKFLSSIIVVLVSTSAIAAPPNYNDQIKPILRKYCLKCHGNDEQKSGLNMQSYQSLLKGGSGGAIVKPGNASGSRLLQIITADDEAARMPPNSPRLPSKVIASIRSWVQSGLRETSSSKSLAANRVVTFTPGKDAASKPAGAPPMPKNLPVITVPKTRRPLPVMAMATNPWSPLLAVAGYKHIRLLNTKTRKTIGRLPYPQGVPLVLRFSRNGKTLLAAGGKPVQSGGAVLYDVVTGKVLAQVGDELDWVRAADVSPDQRTIVLGSSSRVAKAYSTVNGKQLYRLTKHTDWIMAAAFSPDGKRLATGDRAGGIHVWDAKSGGLLLSLANHKGAVRGLSWRSDSKVLASAGDDGRLIWWNVESGFVVFSKTTAHNPQRPAGVFGKLPNGVLHAHFARDGFLISCGRDRNARLWDSLGRLRVTIKLASEVPLQVAISHDNKTMIVGDSAGKVHFRRR